MAFKMKQFIILSNYVHLLDCDMYVHVHTQANITDITFRLPDLDTLLL